MVRVKGDLHVHIVHVSKVCSQVKPNYFVYLLHAWVNTAVGQTKNVWGSGLTWQRILPKNDSILLDSSIIGRVTGTAWHQLLWARNSPSPHER